MISLPQSVKRAIWEGFRNIGTLNGIPPVRDAYSPNISPISGRLTNNETDPDKAMACFHSPDGSTYWRHTGLGSV